MVYSLITYFSLSYCQGFIKVAPRVASILPFVHVAPPLLASCQRYMHREIIWHRSSFSYACHFFQFQGAQRIFAQHKLPYLAAGSQGIALHKLEVARDFLVTNLALAISTQLLLGEWFALFGTHHSQEFLAKEGIRHTPHLRINHFGMATAKFLNLTRKDILTATNDHILEPTHDIDIAALIHCRQIARMQPSCAIDCFRCLFGHFIVTSHHEVAATA